MPLNPKQTAHSLPYSLAVELERAVARGGERDRRGLLNNGKVSNVCLSRLIMSYFVSRSVRASRRKGDLNKSPWQCEWDAFPCLVGLRKGHHAGLSKLPCSYLYLILTLHSARGTRSPEIELLLRPSGVRRGPSLMLGCRGGTREAHGCARGHRSPRLIPRSPLGVFSRPISSTIIKRCTFRYFSAPFLWPGGKRIRESFSPSASIAHAIWQAAEQIVIIVFN